MIQLRTYQSEGITDIRQAFVDGFKAPLYVLPTGGGKTVLFSAISESSQKRGRRVLIMAHRVELVDQIVASLNNFGVQPDIIAAGYQRRAGRGLGRADDNHIMVASVQTLVRRLDTIPAPTLIICDEAHHAAAGNSWSTIIRHWPNAKILGVTATPIRLDSRGLSSTFDKLIVGPTVRQLTDLGYLTPLTVYAPPTVDTSGLHMQAGDFKTKEAEALVDVPSITGDAISHYQRHAPGLPALAFCTSVEHAHHVAEKFRSVGIDAIALDGGTNRDIRRMAVQDFRDGKIRVMASCDLFSEGFDVPSVHVGIMLRPTASEALFRQQVGRILRPAPGKTRAILLDHVGNVSIRFGFPDEPREWTLTEDVVRKKKKPAPAVRVCTKCFAASPQRALKCVECGEPFPIKGRADLIVKDGELVELTPAQVAAKKERREQGRAATLAELEEIARIKGHKPGWALHVLQARQAKKVKGRSTYEPET